MDIKPNPGCANSLCCRLQQAYQQHQASPAAQQQRQAAQQAAALQQEEAATHDDNEWGIEVVSEPASSQQPQQHAVDNSTQQQNKNSYDHSLPEGLQYETPVSCFGACCFMLVGPVLWVYQELPCAYATCSAKCQLKKDHEACSNAEAIQRSLESSCTKLQCYIYDGSGVSQDEPCRQNLKLAWFLLLVATAVRQRLQICLQVNSVDHQHTEDDTDSGHQTVEDLMSQLNAL